jgi:glycosyltransferase involved in cell wall biosynthesis
MKISVLMSVYFNDELDEFKLSLESILNQTLVPSEIIIVHDGPVKPDITNYIYDKTNEGYNIISVKLKVNLGLGIALNTGLNHCTNEFVARMDSDDIALESRLYIQSEYLYQHKDIVLVGCYMYEFDEIPNTTSKVRTLPLHQKEIERFSKLRNPFNHPTVMFRKSIILNLGSYKNMLFFEDYFLWLKILKNGFKTRNINEPLLFFRNKNFVKRRRGLKYLYNELVFYKNVYNEKLLPFHYIFLSLIIKIPLRILPHAVTKLFYQKFLRKKILNK